jgi:uncharacterized protein
MADSETPEGDERAADAAYFRGRVRAAERGDLDALHDVAARYATGDGPGAEGRDEARAFELYASAAERGHALSQYDLGFMLILGEGAAKDEAKGLWWMEQAAANGCDLAARFLSDVYAKGHCGAGIDEAEAARWAGRERELKGRA